MIIDFSIVCIIYVDNFTFLVWPIAPTSGETSCTITLNSDFDNLLDIYQCIQSLYENFPNILEKNGVMDLTIDLHICGIPTL